MGLSQVLSRFFEEERASVTSPLASLLKIPRLHALLPYEGYDPETKLFFNQGSTGFVLEGNPLVGASLKDQGQMADFFRQESNLPEGSSLQFLLLASPRIRSFFDYWKQYKEGEVFQKLAARRSAFLEEKAFSDPLGHLVRDFKVVISYTVPGLKHHLADLEALKEVRRSLQGSLEMIGMSTRLMEAEGLINCLSDLLTFDDSTAPHALVWNQEDSLSKQILSPDHTFGVERDHVVIKDGEWHAKSWIPRRSPLMWALPHMDRFLGNVLDPHQTIPCPWMLQYGIFVEPHQGRKKAKIGARRESLETSLKNRMTKWLPGLEEKYQECSEVVEQLQKGERCILSSFSLTAFYKPQDGAIIHQHLKRIWTSIGWDFVPALYDHLGLLLSSLPMMGTLGEKRKWQHGGLTSEVYGCMTALNSLGKAKRTITKESQNMLPILGEWKGHSTPGMVLIGRRGQPFFWSPFGKALVQSADMQTNHDYNLCIAGTMGSGKSVLMNELMTNVLSVGGRVIVLDKGRSFKNACLLLGGQHIEFNIRSPLSLNPFTHIPEAEEFEADRKEMLSLLNPLIQMMASPLIGTNDAQDNHIAKAIQGVWESKKSKSSIEDVAQFLTTSSEAQAKEVGHLLHQFTRAGDYGCFFNDPANVDLTSRLVVIETDDLRNHAKLLPVIIQMLILQVNQMIAKTDRSKPFILMIDEAWELLKGKKTGSFIEQAARTVRKYKGSLTLATQSTKDYFRDDCPGATVAWENSAWKCILAQDDGAIEEMKNIRALQPYVDTEYKETLLKSLRPNPPHYSEVALFGKGIHGLIGRLRLDPFSRLLYSSNPDEFRAVKSRMDVGMSVEEAIEDLIQMQEGRLSSC